VPKDEDEEDDDKPKRRHKPRVDKKEERKKQREEERIRERDEKYEAPPKPLEGESALSAVDVAKSVSEAYKLVREGETKVSRKKLAEKVARLWCAKGEGNWESN